MLLHSGAVARLRACAIAVYWTQKQSASDIVIHWHWTHGEYQYREYESYNRLRVVWSRCLLYFSLKLGCPVTSHFFTVLMLNQAHLSSKAHFLQQSSVNIFSINEYFRFMRVSVHDIFKAKTIFVCHDWQRQHFIFLILRTREHVYHNKIKIESFRGNSVQAGLSEVATDRTRPFSTKIDLAY